MSEEKTPTIQLADCIDHCIYGNLSELLVPWLQQNPNVLDKYETTIKSIITNLWKYDYQEELFFRSNQFSWDYLPPEKAEAMKKADDESYLAHDSALRDLERILGLTEKSENDKDYFNKVINEINKSYFSKKDK